MTTFALIDLEAVSELTKRVKSEIHSDQEVELARDHLKLLIKILSECKDHIGEKKPGDQRILFELA